MTRYPSYSERQARSGRRGGPKKPIRRDRVAIALIVLVAVIVVPIILRSGSSEPRDPLVITSNDTPTTTAAADGGLDLPDLDDPEISATLPDLPSTSSDSTSTTTTFSSHTVQDGETIADVAYELGVSRAVLLASNQLLGTEQLQPGQKLYASTRGILHTIKAGQTLTDIALTYAVPAETIATANGMTTGTTIYAGNRLLIPGVTASYWADVVTLSRGVSTRFIWPLEGDVVSEFGWRIHPVLGERQHHDGIDLDVPEGTLVHAAASGDVYYYGEQPGYGNVLILEHADGFYSVYGHLSSSLVYKGQYVEVGQAIARTGNTGISDGPHLHFEVRNGTFPVDPTRYLP